MKTGWRWSNVPLPEAHLILIVIGVILGVLWPLAIGLDATWLTVAGVVLVVLGVVLVVWATWTAGRVKLTYPDRLVTAGPYGVSRHPMYVAWTLIYLGLVLMLDSGWLVILAPILAVWIHWESGREERRLLEDFGPEYEKYRSRVRRYL